MKKITAAIIAILFTSVAVNATTPEASFELDAVTLESDFAELDEIEKYVESEGVTLEELTAERADLLGNVELISETSAVFTTEEMPLVGGFWWGCCLSVIGLALVYFITDNDREQVKNALIGCVIGTLLFGVSGILTFF